MGVNTVALAHHFIRQYVRPGDFCIDATAGRGRDTQLLCELVGETGRVLAFDIQEAAVGETRARLDAAGLGARCDVIQDSHSAMERYAEPGSARCVVFNFGYLPGGSHQIYTRAETSIPAIEAGLRLLAPGGVMSLSIYYGGQTGYAERDALLAFLNTVDNRKYTVLTAAFANRPNDPPIPVFIWKEP